MWQNIQINKEPFSIVDRAGLHEYLLDRFGQTSDCIVIEPLWYLVSTNSSPPLESFLRHNSIKYEKAQVLELEKISDEFTNLKESIGEYFATRQIMNTLKKILAI